MLFKMDECEMGLWMKYQVKGFERLTVKRLETIFLWDIKTMKEKEREFGAQEHEKICNKNDWNYSCEENQIAFSNKWIWSFILI